MDAIDKLFYDKGMHPDAIDLERECQKLMEHMQLSLGPGSEAICMYPSYIPMPERMPEKGSAIALDAGGTNFRAARVEFEHGRANIVKRDEYPMPGTRGELDRDGFLNACADYVEPFLEGDDSIGYVFSYPALILPNRDGRLTLFQKEVKVIGCEGMEICASLEETLVRRGVAGKRRYSLLNDTVAALVGGAGQAEGELDGALGLIYGTGTNTCYYDPKMPEKGIINMESSGYTLFPRGEMDLVLDKNSAVPGDNIYEKMSSSAYMGTLTRLCALAAGGLISAELEKALREKDDLGAVDLDVFMRTGTGVPGSMCRDAHDKETLEKVIKLLYRRAAKLCCCVLAAAMETSGAGEKAPARIVAEGSGFWGSLLYAPELDRFMTEFVTENKKRRWQFVKANEANLIGAAVAALI